MADDKTALLRDLVNAIPSLTLGQLHWIHRVVKVFGEHYRFSASQSDIFDEVVLRNFGDAMRVHHSFSAEPFSKDKFEYVLVEVLRFTGRQAALAPKGNAGHDISIDDVRISLKTQADKGIKDDCLWVSKFMELGKGAWGSDPQELTGLRQQFLDHLQSYDRILMLRALHKGPVWKYELVEIPRQLLMAAEHGRLEMKLASKQTPKPGYCYVKDPDGRDMYELYFDGGTERKLQIKNLQKQLCIVHATWEFAIPAA